VLQALSDENGRKSMFPLYAKKKEILFFESFPDTVHARVGIAMIRDSVCSANQGRRPGSNPPASRASFIK
jgi:hypothetical protein